MNPEGTLEHAIRVLRRRKLVFFVAFIGVPLIAFVVSASKSKQYTATATLLFQSSNTGSVDPARAAATNEALTGLPVIADQTAKNLGGGITAIEVMDSVSVSAGSGMTDIAKVSATTAPPELSARIANAYSRAYIGFRRQADQSQVQEAINLVNHSLSVLSPAELAGPQGQTLQDRLNQLKVEQALQTGKTELVQPAGVPSTPSSPKTGRNVILGIILGALLGLGLIALLERIDRRVRSVEELEELFGVPIIARIPRNRSLSRARPGDPLEPHIAEAFRVLRTNLRYFNIDKGPQSILFASPEPGDGKSTAARGLAETMAEMGDKVLFVEADLRKESEFHDLSHFSMGGLSSVLMGVPLEETLIEVEVPAPSSEQPRTLSILPSGPAPPNPSELFESERMEALLAELMARFDIVVIDSPALGVVSDTLALVAKVSQVLAVGGVGKTTRDGARNFMKLLSLQGAKPVGLVATLTAEERDKYSYYHRVGVAARS